MVPLVSGASGPRPPRDLVLPALLALSLALRLVAALRPLPALDDLAIPDDAYLSLTIARSLAHGLGPFYGLAPTSGFQPLYVLFMAPVFALVPHDPITPVRVAQAMLALCDTAALFFIYRIVARASVARATPALVGLAWAFNPYAIQTSLNALETSLAFLLLVVVFDAVDRLRRAGPAAAVPRRLAGVGALVGLAMLARIDAVFLLPAVGWPILADHARAGLPLRRAAAALAACALAAAAVYAPWLAWSFAATGDLLPVSGSAVRYMCLSSVHHQPTVANTYLPMLLDALGVIARKNAPAIALAGALVVLLAAVGGRRALRDLRAALRPHDPVGLFGACILTAYAFWVFGPWHFPRYLFPLALAFALVAAAAMDLLLARIGDPARRRLAVAAFAVAILAASAAHPAFRRLYAPGTPEPWGYMRIGLWAREHFAPGTVIGGSQTGALGYFADKLTVVNLDGVVNKACLEAMRQKRAMDYLRESGVEFLVWQDDIDFLARESRRTSPGDLVPLGEVEGIRTWGEPWHVYQVRR